jgi:hypothetical protein
MSTTAFGVALFADVAAYGSRTSHRTGTDDDDATIDWLRACCEIDGASVVLDSWTFRQWRATWSAEIDGSEIDALPVFYETIGHYGPEEIDVVATPHPGGLLTVKNRRVRNPPAGVLRPSMQVAGCYGERVHEVRAQIIDACVVEGRSANVLAGYGCDFADAEVLIATPMSGWFSCASERGTGIAIARWLACELAAQGHRVGLLGTSGHELFNLGLEHHLSTRPTTASAIVHIGASVAARNYSVEGVVALSDAVFAFANRPDVTTALGAVGFGERIGSDDPSEWIGEGTRWCTQRRPLLSVAGVSHWFHTPDDRAEQSTHPDLLATVAPALLDASAALLASARGSRRQAAG